MKRFVWGLLLAVCVVVTGVWAGEKGSGADASFEALKKMAGSWVAVGADGKATDRVVSIFRVTAGGSVVQETLFPGTDHEMITMYSMDGGDLVLTHYCAMGNQPRMKAEPGKDPGKIVFKFTGAGNLKSPNDAHMNHATLNIGKDKFQAEWVALKDGKPIHHANFNLVRKP